MLLKNLVIVPRTSPVRSVASVLLEQPGSVSGSTGYQHVVIWKKEIHQECDPYSLCCKRMCNVAVRALDGGACCRQWDHKHRGREERARPSGGVCIDTRIPAQGFPGWVTRDDLVNLFKPHLPVWKRSEHTLYGGQYLFMVNTSSLGATLFSQTLICTSDSYWEFSLCWVLRRKMLHLVIQSNFWCRAKVTVGREDNACYK